MKAAGTHLLKIALLVLAAVLCGGLANSLSPNRIPWVEDWDNLVESKAGEGGIALVDVDMARQIVEEGGATIIDARSMADYDAGHLPGALSLPSESMEETFEDIMLFLVPDLPIMTYCSGKACDESLLVSVFLKEQGFTNVVLFAGGIAAWNEQGLPLE